MSDMNIGTPKFLEIVTLLLLICNKSLQYFAIAFDEEIINKGCNWKIKYCVYTIQPKQKIFFYKF